MNILVIERDIKTREESLKRCKYNLSIVKRHHKKEAAQEISAEILLLEDQLEKYHVLFNILREDQPVYDEVLPRV
jgi:hypothetical protein